MYTFFVLESEYSSRPQEIMWVGSRSHIKIPFEIKLYFKIEWNKKIKEGFRGPWCKETGPVLIAAQPLPSFLSALVLERRAMFAAVIAGERIVLPEETSRIKTNNPPQRRVLACADSSFIAQLFDWKILWY